MLETKKSYRLKKNIPNRSNPNCINLIWFRSDFIFKVKRTKPNQTKPHAILSCGSDDLNPQNRTKPRCEHP